MGFVLRAMSWRWLFAAGLIAGVMGIVCSRLVAAEIAGDGEAALKAKIAAKSAQLTTLSRNITRWGCDKAMYATSVDGCVKLNDQARGLEAEIADLKAEIEKPKPGEDQPNPNAAPSQSSDAQPKPSEEQAAPGNEQASPSDKQAKPGEEPATPGNEQAAPREQQAAPGNEQAAPGSEQAAPNDEDLDPDAPHAISIEGEAKTSSDAAVSSNEGAVVSSLTAVAAIDTAAEGAAAQKTASGVALEKPTVAPPSPAPQVATINATPNASLGDVASLKTEIAVKPEGSTPSVDEAGLEIRITNGVRQLTVLSQNIHRWGCDRPMYATSVEGCIQLNGQARDLAAELDALKSQAGPLWTSDKEAAAEASAFKARPLAARRYTFRQETNPGTSYRTVCVRLCDGFYFPVSEATQPGNFLTDQQRCQSSCSSPTKLFYQSLPADDANTLVALTGEHYDQLLNAYRYRAQYVDSCSCGPKPWSAEAQAEYERRAVIAQRTPEETIVASGATEVGKILAGASETVVAEAKPVTKVRYTKTKVTSVTVDKPRVKVAPRLPRYTLVAPGDVTRVVPRRQPKQRYQSPPSQPFLQFLFGKR
jgi:hypothetical protein